MGGAVFPPCSLTWGQTMVEVMKIMATSFKRSHAHTATFSAFNSAAGHRWPTPPPETPGHSQASLGQSLVGSLLLSPMSWCAQVSFVPSKSLFPQSRVTSGGSVVGLMATSFKRAFSTPRSTAPRAPVPSAVQCWPVPPQETLKHSSVSVSVGSLGPCMHKVWALWASLADVGLNLNTVSTLLPSCWGFSFALGHGESPQSHSSSMQPLLQHWKGDLEVTVSQSP